MGESSPVALEGEAHQRAVDARRHLRTALEELPPASPGRNAVQRALEELEALQDVEATADRLREELPTAFREDGSTEPLPATS